MTRSERLGAVLLALALGACTSKSPTPAPDAPLGVQAAAGDGAVTVSWEASPGATGYRVYYNTDASGAVSKSSLAVDAGDDLFFAVTGLLDGTAYRFAVAARNASGEGALSAEVKATPALNAPLAVASTTPQDGAAGVSRTTPVAIVFNRAAASASITAQSASGACSGSVQLSSDGFNSCTAFSGTPVASAGNTSFAFTLAAPLPGSATFQLRITTAARDANGIALTQQFTQAHGFTTSAALALVSVAPADGATQVPLDTTVTATFNRGLTASSATVNSTSQACTGALQLSTQGFAANSCVAISSAQVVGSSVVLTPAAAFPAGALVQLRVTTALLDDGGNPLGADATSAGFTTAAPLAVTQVSPDDQTDVDFQPTLSVAFNGPALASSITTNIGTSTACSGAIQLSRQSDAFASNTCVPMLAPPASTDGGITFTFTPAQPLGSSTAYLIRVTTEAQSQAGSPLAAAYTSQGFTTRALAVVSLAPADGATNLPRNGSIAITFNRPIDPGSVANQTCSAASAGPFILTNTSLDTCTPLATPVVNGSTVMLTPTTLLNGSTNYSLQITTSLKDTSGGALSSTFSTSSGFTTLPALAVVSTNPGAAATNVALNSNLLVTFNQPTLASSITDSTSGGGTGAACGSISLVAASGTCLAFKAQPVASPDGKTFTLTPASNLASSTVYTITVSTAAEDATGAPLPATYSTTFTTGSNVDTSAPGEVTGLAVTPALQSLALSWTNPTDADFAAVNIYLCSSANSSCSLSGAGVTPLAVVPGASGATASTTLTGLTPYTSYTLRVSTVDQSGDFQSQGKLPPAVTTVFTGTRGDFSSGQVGKAVGAGDNNLGVSVWFTWSAAALYVAIGNSDGSTLMTSNQDVLWLAVDTDPGVDATGEWATPSAGNNDVIWPFKADYVAQLIPNSTGSSVQIHSAGGCALIVAPETNPITSGCANASGALAYDGSFESGLDEFSIPASALGDPTAVRLAFAALNSTNGYAYALAPSNPNAIDVTGYFASATSSYNPGSNVFVESQAANSALSSTSPLSPSASLVTVAVQSSTLPTLKGSLHPLSYTLSDVQFALRDDGTGGDATAGDGVYSGAFNFGAVSEPLFFKFGSAGADEFAAGSDRVWTLSGAAEALPQLVLGTPYSKTHTFELTFQVLNPQGQSNNKEVLGSVTELGNFISGKGAAMTLQSGTTWSTAAVPFASHDFTTTPLQWKAHDNDGSNGGAGTWEPSPASNSSNHTMNDDVINKRTLSWTWGDYSNDPF